MKENNHPGYCKSVACEDEECKWFQGRESSGKNLAVEDIIDKVQDCVYGLNLNVDGEEYNEILGQIKNSIWLRGEVRRIFEQALESQMSDLRKEVEKKRKEEGQTEQCKDVLAMNYLIGRNKGFNQALDEVLLLMKK